MGMMNITFKQVDAFRAVVSSGSVTGASVILGTSQPAVSRLISDLEKEIGYELFFRVGRQLEPTEEARLLVKEVRQAVTGMSQIKDVAVEIGHFGHARLSIMTSPSFSYYITSELISSFSRICPEVKVKFDIGQDDDTVEWMINQGFDFGMTVSRPTNPTIACHLIDESPLFCIVPKDHRLIEHDIIKPSDLAEEQLISYMANSPVQCELDKLFLQHGIVKDRKYEIRTTSSIRGLVASGLGVSVIGSWFDPKQFMPECVAIPFDSDLKIQAFFFWSTSRPLSPVAREFKRIAEERFKFS